MNYHLVKEKLIRKIKEIDFHDYRILVVLALLLILLGWGGYVLTQKLIDRFAKRTYEVAVMVRSQNNPDPIEDARSSLKSGDVLAVKEVGHQWSDLEKISYLIIKMDLNRSQAVKIKAPEYRKTKYANLSSENMAGLNARLKEGGLKEVPREIIRARIYRINMEKYFKDFEPLILLRKQPFQDKIYDWSIAEKK